MRWLGAWEIKVAGLLWYDVAEGHCSEQEPFGSLDQKLLGPLESRCSSTFSVSSASIHPLVQCGSGRSKFLESRTRRLLLFAEGQWTTLGFA